jgi:hypothetical protein
LNKYELKEESQKIRKMTLISIEEAKSRLADCNVLLKYMSFLQNNGLSDCGKGQIIGQASLLQEYLRDGEEQQQGNKQLTADKSTQQQREQQQHKQQQEIRKDAYEAGKIPIQTFEENAPNNNISKSKPGLLRQVEESMIDKPKEAPTAEKNKGVNEYRPSEQIHKTLVQPIEATTREDDANKWQPQIGAGVIAKKETDQSWINKIKKMTEVENWRS